MQPTGPTAERVFLRVDVDSFLGTRDGVPELLRVFSRHGIRATFFLTVGPDRWGRAVFRMFRRRGFLSKMLRTRAVHSYGLSTCLRGTLLPSVNISRRLPDVLRWIADEGHEVGLHCWDHVLWQDKLWKMDADAIRKQVRLGAEAFADVIGSPPPYWAAPGWVTTPTALRVLDEFPFRWMSNSRGPEPFVPVVAGRELRTVEIPTSLSTLDEDLGRGGVEEHSYVDHVLGCIRSTPVRVFVIHAETEGRKYRPLFEELIARVTAEGLSFAPLGELAAAAEAQRSELPRASISYAEIPGRSGLVSVQGEPALAPAERGGV